MQKEKESKKTNIHLIREKYRGILLVLLIALCLEIFVFNFRTFQSLFYEEVSLMDTTMTTEGMTDYGNGYYVLQDGESSCLHFENINVPINNLFIDIEVPTSIALPYMETNVCNVTVFIGDEASEYLYDVSTGSVLYEIPSTKYLWFKSMGDVHAMDVEFSLPSGYSIQIHDIVLNASRPLCFSLGRFLGTFFVVLLLYLLRKDSVLWREDCKEWTPTKKVTLVFLVGLTLMLGWFFITQNGAIVDKRDFTPYQELAKAFGAGQVSLLQEPSAELIAMENPYDYRTRKVEGIDFLWDYAYYEGNYYVYFGVVPCVLFYYPFYSMTGLNLPDEIPSLFCAGMFVLGCFLLLRKIICKYFPKTPYAMLFLMSGVMGFGCQIPYFLVQPEAYNIPLITGMMLSVWGLYFWFAFLLEEKRVRYFYLVMGALCMALVFGCRPQMGLFSFLAVPLFLPMLRDKTVEKKEKTKFLIGFGIPYLSVAALLMYYNYIRFGSVTDFGAMYNLTIFDMTKVSTSIEKVFYGIFEYLFRIPSVDITYPFVDWMEASHHLWNHMVFYSEPSLGGLFACNLILFTAFLGLYVRKDMKQRGIGGLAIALATFSLVILIFDSEIVGAVYRYLADYSFALFILCFLVLFTIWEKVKGKETEKYFRHAFVILCLLSLAFNLLIFVATGLKFPLSNGNTILYYELQDALSFW